MRRRAPPRSLASGSCPLPRRHRRVMASNRLSFTRLLLGAALPVMDRDGQSRPGTHRGGSCRLRRIGGWRCACDDRVLARARHRRRRRAQLHPVEEPLARGNVRAPQPRPNPVRREGSWEFIRVVPLVAAARQDGVRISIRLLHVAPLPVRGFCWRESPVPYRHGYGRVDGPSRRAIAPLPIGHRHYAAWCP